MTKFKVGDIVILKNINLSSDSSGDGPISEFIGNIFKITKVESNTKYPYRGEIIKGLDKHSEGELFSNIPWRESEIELYGNISWRKLLVSG